MKYLYYIVARILGCRHKWRIIQTTQIYDPSQGMEVPVGTRFTMQCSKCGNLKFKRA